MVTLKDKNAFWDVVEDCLVAFHHLSKQDAKGQSANLRERIEASPNGFRGDNIYHDEPFDVACDIAENPLDLSNYRCDYEEIVNRRNW